MALKFREGSNKKLHNVLIISKNIPQPCDQSKNIEINWMNALASKWFLMEIV